MDRARLEAAVAAQERLRGIVDDDVIDVAIAALHERLVMLSEPKRRQATILFADIVGFTALSQTLDAEVVTNLVDALWRRLDAVIVQNGGYVDKHMGDAVMALWGADSTLENDPERAVGAALELQRVVASFADSTGHRVSMRIGVNTGPVLLATVGSTGEYTAMGDAVNTASRLEHAAPTGGVCISHDTYQHVRGIFDVQRLGPLVLKGKPVPQEAYLVARVKPRRIRVATSSVEGIATSTIGRDGELALLRSMFDEAASGRCSRLAVIVGEAGAGKTRLLFEFTDWLDLFEAEVFYFHGRSSPQRRGQPLGLVMDLLAARAGVVELDSPDDVLEKLITELAGVLTREEVVVLATWLGFDMANVVAAQGVIAGEGVSLSAKAYLQRYIAVLAEQSPVVWLLEDVHWADDESLDLVVQLVDTLVDSSFFVIAAVRPDLAERRPAWGSALSGCRQLDLPALDSAATGALVDEILQRVRVVPPALRSLVVERSEGNPFYAEELIKMLIDDGVIVLGADDDEWTIDELLLQPDRVPTTLTGVLQARLDGLPIDDRRALQRGAVIGRVFWDAAVASLDGERGDRPTLQAALGRELVLRQVPAAFVDTEQLSFKHALLRDVAYETVLLADRPMLHARAAAWLGAVAGARRGEYLAVIASHHRLAGDSADAAACFDQLATAALRSGQLRPALVAIDDALALWAEVGTPPPAAAQLCRAEARLKLGDLDGADEAARAASSRAAETGDDSTLVGAACCSAAVAQKRGFPHHGLELCRDVLPIAAGLSGPPLVNALTSMVRSMIDIGDLDAAAVTARRALTVAETTDDPAALSKCLEATAVIASELGDLDVALQHMSAGLAIAVDAGDLAKVADLRLNLGVVHHLRGDESNSADDYRLARTEYEAARQLATQLDRRLLQATALCNMAQVSVRLGDASTAVGLADESLKIALELGAIPDALHALLSRAEALAMLGRVDESVALLAMIRTHPATPPAGQHEVDRALHRLGLDETSVTSAMVLTFDDVTAAALGS